MFWGVSQLKGQWQVFFSFGFSSSSDLSSCDCEAAWDDNGGACGRRRSVHPVHNLAKHPFPIIPGELEAERWMQRRHT